MVKRKTNEEFKQEIHSLFGNEYTLLSEYTNKRTKVKIRHNKCGNIYEVLPNNLLRGTHCPKCSLKRRAHKFNDNFKQEVYDLVGDEYTVLGEYINERTKVKIRHNKCGNVYKVIPSNFLRGNRCPKCQAKVHDNKIRGRLKYTDDEFKQDIYNLVGDEYTFLEKYQGYTKKLKVKHNVCGYVYEVSPRVFKSGYRCPNCVGNIKKTDKQFKQEVFKLVGNEYTFLDPYVSRTTKIRVKHNKCGNVYSVAPGTFLQDHGCPFCYQHGSSKGNTWIDDILTSYNINFKREYRFDDLVDRRTLPFDFYLPDIDLCIEYDGMQHTNVSSKYYSKNTVKHDKMKDQYCLSKGIRLIRIPYNYDTKDKVEKILKEHIHLQ